MTDYEKLKTLLIEFGVEFLEEHYSHPKFGSIESITCRVGNKKVSGWKGLESEFKFKPDQTFLELEILDN